MVSRLLASACLFFGLLSLPAAPAFAQNAQEQIESGLCAGANLQITDEPSGECEGDAGATERINQIIRAIINILSLIVGIVAVIMIMIGGFRYITSGGSETGVTGAKNTILYAIIGLLIVAVAQVLVRFVLQRITT